MDRLLELRTQMNELRRQYHALRDEVRAIVRERAINRVNARWAELETQLKNQGVDVEALLNPVKIT